MPDAPIEITTPQYVWAARRSGLLYWLTGGPDYSRSVEYPLATRLIGIRPGQRVLDVGSGRRAELATMLAERGARVTGIDAREDVGAEVDASAGIEFHRGDARAMPFEDASFDAVLAVSTIEHIEDGVDRAVSEMARVLAPGGRLVISVPYNPLKVGKMYLRGEIYGNRGDRVFFCHVFDEDALTAQVLEPAGLPLVERVNLGEPGRRLSTLFYAPRGAAKAIRRIPPLGPLFGLSAPRFLRPIEASDYSANDWLGVPTMLAFERPAA